jgi:hypothetical protein
MGQVQDTLDWKPQQPGDYSLAVELPAEVGESRADNNRVEIPVTIREEQLRVLIVESTPRWEYRYLRNALERDPGVEVHCLLFHPDLSTRGGGRGYLQQFPTEQELFKYDVVFLGDVGVVPGQLTTTECDNLRQLVRAQAGGLVFLPGFRGHQHSFATTSLEELYPVILDPARPGGVGSPRPARMRLTEAGRRSLLTRLEPDDAVNERVWERLPGFHWHTAALRARIGTTVLAAHATDSTSSGRVPLIATRVAGTGKVLFMGIDGAWRWRKGVEDLYHYRFWGQVVRWMAYQRTMSQGESMRLFYAPDRPDAGNSLALNVNVLNSSGEPLRAGTVTVQTIAPSGRTDSVRLSAAGDEAWGLFTGRFTPDEGGDWTLITTCDETGARLETRLTVQGKDREAIGEPARFDVLQEVAQITRGELTDLADVSDLITRIAAMPEPDPEIVPLRLWCHPAWAAALVVLLGTFWTCRKLAGLA